MTEERASEPPALIRIGYWAGPHTAPGWPDPQDFVDPTWDPDERDEVHYYLGQGTVVRAFMGLSECRFCGERVGSLEFTDGVYVWPEGLAHYLQEHSVRLPAAVVDHVRTALKHLESAPVDNRWWKNQTSWR